MREWTDSSMVQAMTVYPKKYAHGSCFAVLCCGYVLTDLPISIRLTSLALWQSNDCPSASKATLVNMGKCIMWIHYEWLHNHNKAKQNKTVCKFLGVYCKILANHTAYTIIQRVVGWLMKPLMKPKSYVSALLCFLWLMCLSNVILDIITN